MYETLAQPQPVETGDKIEIVDVFWYGCPFCYRFLPYMEYLEQNLPDYAEIRRLPAIFRDTWRTHAQGYYTAHALGISEEHHRGFFERIHKDGVALDTKESIIDFYNERSGVDKAKLEETWNSPAVSADIDKSLTMQQRYEIQGTPTIIVHGKYKVGGQLAGTYENMIRITLLLAEHEHRIRQPVKSHALALPPPESGDAATLRIQCKQDTACSVAFDCSAQATGEAFQGTLPQPIPAWGAVSVSASDIQTHTGGESWSGKGRLGCALRSSANIGSQVWTRSGEGVLVNNSAAIRSVLEGEAHRADIESIPSPDSDDESNIRIRCSSQEADCLETVFVCYTDDGNPYEWSLGTIERLTTRHIQSEALASGIEHRWEGLGLTCEVRSKGSFTAQVLTRTGGGGALVNNSATGG